ncbi:PilZ domain-containing protein [Planomonospora algeriensis]
MIDVSTTGLHCALLPDSSLQKGDLVEVDLPLPGERPLSLSATIVHRRTHDGTVEIGLHFTDVPRPVEDRIHHYVVAALSDPD